MEDHNEQDQRPSGKDGQEAHFQSLSAANGQFL
jgi:hypothetical protein